ncbi:MAG: MarR family transcriptional regulator [Peptococcaceae bacterium]|nr:MarR family transcriptional regulator [Peptococcaceae bacterium]MDH7526300.1 MarR family transcriptional regulator [Peptococcaceae bacterium]
MNYNDMLDLFVDNMKKLFFPEEWIAIDLAMSKQELFTLLLVERHGEIIMSQIAGHVNIPMSTATGIVDRLVKKGFLVRERSDSDRRIVVIRLTGKGKELINTIKQKGNEYMQMIKEGLTEEEQEFLLRIFIKIFDIINKNRPGRSEGGKEKAEIKKIDIE